ncbi:MAG: non-ribosomal peptide synthetase [bacterium]
MSEHGRIEQRILAQAMRTPDKVAIRTEGEPLTYAGLAHRAQTVAAHLEACGAAPGDSVAVVCPRGVDGLVGILGLLLAGAVYVPISPRAPRARVRDLLVRAGCRLALTHESCLGLVEEETRVLPLDQLARNPIPGADRGFEGGDSRGADAPAYIMYTSGSTGRPKGVVVSHGAALNTLAWMVDAFTVTAHDRFLQKTTWSFTDSIWELFLPLLVGGELAFASDDVVRDPRALYLALRESGAALTQFVPPVLQTFLDAVEVDVTRPELPQLRWILNGGEELPRSLVDRWFGLFPRVGFANSYGMTESAIYATCYFMSEPPVYGMRRIPIGRAISGAEVHVVDEFGLSVGVDSPGEICIGGRSLMDGYRGDPGLTADAFLSLPDSARRLYRTGDLGAWRPDGELAYLGRADHQIKIRGMRVEPGEIEQVLLRHDGVRQAVVVASGAGERLALRAFYTAPGRDPGERALLAHMRQLVPDYMVPARCVVLDEIPLTAHGKVDRAALAGLDAPPAVAAPDLTTEAGEVERVLVQVWTEVLGHGDFDLDAGFFDAGGNSLLLVRVFASLPEAYRRSITLADLVRHPSIRAIANLVRSVSREDSGSTGTPEGLPERERTGARLEELRRKRTRAAEGGSGRRKP